jgi:nitroimidazol reductase NimA-like FMN-containing flavoprotein (pyridoxamine 5'-phosphate oxidase superfamily)
VTSQNDDGPGPGFLATLSPVPETQCWQLLASAQVGRLGLLVDGRPEVLPVNYILDGESVLFRTAEGTVLTHAARKVVAFQVDRVDEAVHEGWSVLVQGRADDISDAIDANSERMRRLSLVTWAPGTRHRWFRIQPDKVTGRRLRLTPDAL